MESDAVCIARLGAGDDSALVELYDRYGGYVYSIARRVVRDRTLAEDVTQDVFCHLWENPGAHDPGRGSLRTFIGMLAHRRSVDCVRRTAASRRRGLSSERRPPIACLTSPTTWWLTWRRTRRGRPSRRCPRSSGSRSCSPGVVLVALGATMLWRVRRSGGSRLRRWGRRSGLAVGGLVLLNGLAVPISVAFTDANWHTGYELDEIPLGPDYERVDLETNDGLTIAAA